MKKNVILLLMFLQIIVPQFLSAHDGDNSIFTQEENNYIKDNPKVTVGMVKDFIPFSFEENGELKGISVELYKMIEENTGLNIQIKLNNWSNNYDSFINGEFDIIDGISYTAKRKEHIIFSEPYFSLPVVVFGNIEMGEFNKLQDLKSRKVGIEQGVFIAELLQNSEINFEEFKDIETAIKNLANGKVDAIITNQNQGMYYIKKNGFQNIKILGQWKEVKEDLRIGVSNKNKILYSIIVKGLNKISKEKLFRLKDKWLNIPIYDNSLRVKFSEKEKEYLMQNPTATISFIKDYVPFSYFDNDELVGFSVDLLQIISEHTGLKFESISDDWYKNLENFKNNKTDIIDCISYKKERTEFTLYSDSYYEIPILVFGKDDFGIYNDINDLKGKKVGIWKDIFYEKNLRDLEGINVVEFDNIEKLIKGLAYEKVDVAVTTLQQGHFYIKKNAITNVKILGQFDFDGINKDDLRYGVNIDKPILHSIINKGLRSVTTTEMRSLKNKWFGLIQDNNQTEFSELENEFIKKHPKITAHIEHDYLPFTFVEDDIPKGYAIEYVNMLAEKIGIDIDFSYNQTWDEALTKLQDKKIDMIISMVDTKERREYTEFTTPFEESYLGIAYSSNNQKYGDLSSLSNKKVAIPKGYACIKKIKKHYPKIVIKEYGDNVKCMMALRNGEVDATITSEIVLLYLKKRYFLPNITISEIRNDKIFSRVSDCFGIRKDWKIFRDIMQKAMNNLGDNELALLRNKWFTDVHQEKKLINLTDEELEYLKNKGPIKMCVDPDWLPFEKIDEKGNHIGMVADYVKLFQNRIGSHIELIPTKSWVETLEKAKEKKCDIIAAANNTPNRSKYINFTTPYISFPFVIATSKKVQFIEDFGQLKNKKIGVIDGYVSQEYIEREFPNIDIVLFDTIKDGLKQVSDGTIYGFIELLPSLVYEMKENDFINLKISGKLDLNSNLSVGVRDDDMVLLGIFQKVVNSITEMEKLEINNRWIAIIYANRFDYSLFWKLIAIAGVILALILFWNYRLSNEIKERKKTEELLKKTHLQLLQNAEDLKKAKAEADIANHAKDEFLSNVTHELRTPLNAVIGFSELLDEMVIDKKQSSFIKSIKSAGKNLLVLINDILDLSKIEANMMQIVKSAVDIRLLFDEMKQMFEPELISKGVKFFISVDENLPEYLMIDELRLKQILINLIGNAEKFTQNGFIKISARSVESTKENEINLILLVEDTGIGIPDNKCDVIFDSFQQHNSVNSNKYGGTGLGLTISSKLSQAMGGKISVNSIEGKGSIFELRFYDLKIANETQIKNANTKIKKKYDIMFEKSQILVIEDTNFNFILMKEILKKIGFDVKQVEKGIDVMSFISQTMPDLIFMNVRVSLIEKNEFIRKIKLDNKLSKIPIVAVSTSSNENGEDIALNYGFSDYIQKPIKTNLLIEMLMKYFKYSIKDEIQTNENSELTIQDFSNVKKVNEFKAILINDVLPECQNLKGVMIISKVIQLGKKLKSISSRYNSDQLQKFAIEFLNYADSFDTNSIENCLDNLISELQIIQIEMEK